MSNSPLVKYTKISPNRTSPRNKPIDRISIHCVVGQCSVEVLGSIFAPASRQASSNYGISPKGWCGMYCEEKDRSWCTSSGANDHRAVTIEVASDTFHPYAVTDAAFAALLDLCTDICQRNGKKKLVWIANKDKALAYTPAPGEMLLTVHRWFANKACPGDYLYNRHAEIVTEVNKRLGSGGTPAQPEPEPQPTTPEQLYRVRKAWADRASQKGAYKVLGNAKACADANPGYNVYDASGNKVYPVEQAPASYAVRVKIPDLNIRKGPGVDYAETGKFTGKGIFTIVEEQQGRIDSSGTLGKWGRLKSGAGWICLAYDKYTAKA